MNRTHEHGDHDDDIPRFEPFECVDLTGVCLRFECPSRRVVSLVPALTETLFAVGAGAAVVGRTRYCVHPDPAVRAVEKIGGTKDPNIARIIELAPDLVLAIREENRREDVAALRAAGLRVHVDEAQTPDDGLRLVALYGSMFDRIEEAARIVLKGESVLETTRLRREERRRLDALRLKPRGAPRTACLIWRKPWMAVGRDTYIGGMIEVLGGVNVFAGNPERYFELSLAELAASAPDIILLPSEPYSFSEAHIEEIRNAAPTMPASRSGGILLCDGEDLSWFGARTPDALSRLRALFVERVDWRGMR